MPFILNPTVTEEDIFVILQVSNYYYRTLKRSHSPFFENQLFRIFEDGRHASQYENFRHQ